MNPEKDAEALDSVQDKALPLAQLAEEAVKRAHYIVANCETFKQPRLKRIQMYRDLYAGKVPPKFRQPFNVVLPVFSGAIDTLQAGLNDDLALDLGEQHPADYIAVKKLNALWEMEATSVAPTAKFAMKARQDRANAIMSGRGFMMNYAVSKPEYHNCFEIFELEDAIFQPRGGGHLENHLYAGRQNITRTESQLKSGPYDQTQVKKLLSFGGKSDFSPDDANDTIKASLGKFKAAGLSPESVDYTGEPVYKLVEISLTLHGTRYNLVFSPWYNVWVRFDKLSSIFSADLYPVVSWATHEDNKNFVSKSFADDLYGVADAVHTLFNQELTNREKSNFNARAYDREMFPDVAKLDLAQSRPDALVPVDTKGGTRRIADGMYTFETAQLSGTINLMDWMNQEAGRDVGVTDLSQGGVQNVSKKATVVFAEQQNISKRLLLRSSPYTEAMGEIGKLFIQGAKDHLPAKKAIKLLGSDGQGWEEITRMDLDLYSDVSVRIISSTQEMRNSQLKKEARLKTLSDISADPNQAAQVNPRWLVEEKLRSGGEYKDHEIAVGMDTKNYGNKEEVSYAYRAIQEVIDGDKPEMFYGATTLFMQIIVDFASNNRNSLKGKYKTLFDFANAHAQIAQENMARKAKQDIAQQQQTALLANKGVPPAAPAETGVPITATSQVRKIAASIA